MPVDEENVETPEEPTEDYSNFGLDDTPDFSEQPGENPDEEGGEDNYPDTWKSILDPLPTEFHKMVAPGLKKWDQGVNQRFQKIQEEYAPWKQFRDQNISPESLLASLQITQRMEQNPEGFYADLRDVLIQQGRIQEAQEVQQHIDDTADENDDDPVSAQVRQLQAQQEQMLAALQQAQEQQQIQQQQAQQQYLQQQASQTVQQEFAALEQKIGPMSDVFRTEVANRAIRMQEQYGREVPLEEAFTDLQRFIAHSRKISPGARAPKVSPGGSGLPMPTAQDLNTFEGRAAAAARIARAMADE